MKGILRKILESDFMPDGLENEIEEVQEHDNSLESYKEKHGKHFTAKLAEFALLMNGPIKWTIPQVEGVMNGMGYKTFANNATIEDVYFVANRSIQLNKDVFNSDVQHLKYTIAVINDPNAYEGHIFCRWVTDMKHKGIEIDWGSY